MKLLALMVLGLLAVTSARVSYTGYHLIRVFANTADQLNFLYELEQPTYLVPWDIERGEDEWALSIKFHVHPYLVDSTIDEINSQGLEYEILHMDLQSEIDEEWLENLQARLKPDDEWFEAYHTYEEILAWIDEQVTFCGSDCTTFSIGNSYEGRQLRVTKLTGADTGCAQKPQIWIDSGIHAREWIAVTTGMYLLDRLIQEYGQDAEVTAMRDNYDWHFLTIVNPDGYAYTWDEDRMWRKTRQPNEGSICYGADANRNFDFMWMTVGASSQPCSDTFAGPVAFSEPEAAAQNGYMMSMEGTWTLFITLHTYGQLWMTPWGYTEDRPADYNELLRVSTAAVGSVFSVHGQVYETGNAAGILYQSSGTSRDWAKGVPMIPYVYTIELRDTSSFVLPPDQIRPTGQEIWAGLRTTVSEIEEVRPPNCLDP